MQCISQQEFVQSKLMMLVFISKWWQLTAEAISICSICSCLCGSCCSLLGCHQRPLDTGRTTWTQTESRSTRPSTRSTGSSFHCDCSGRHRTHYR